MMGCCLLGERLAGGALYTVSSVRHTCDCRLFAYVCSSPDDWPMNRVYCKGWTTEADPYLEIEEEGKASAEESEPSREVTSTIHGRISRKPKA